MSIMQELKFLYVTNKRKALGSSPKPTSLFYQEQEIRNLHPKIKVCCVYSARSYAPIITILSIVTFSKYLPGTRSVLS